jgi:four helix bundle protein
MRSTRRGLPGAPQADDIRHASLMFAAGVVDLARRFPADAPPAVAHRLVEVGADLGANVAEAYASGSARTRLTRLETARRGSRAVRYWLLLAVETGLAPVDDAETLLAQADALHQTLTALCGEARRNAETR